MADFSEMLSQLLSSDEGKQQVSQVLNMLSKPQPTTSAEVEQNTTSSISDGNSDSGGSGNSGNNATGALDIGSLLSALGNGSSSSGSNSGNNATGALDIGSLLSALGNGSSSNGGGNAGGAGLPNLDIAKLIKVQQMLSQRREDESTTLLRALKPHLGEENRKKIDDAVRIMELLALWPLVKESGLLGSILGGDA